MKHSLSFTPDLDSHEASEGSSHPSIEKTSLPDGLRRILIEHRLYGNDVWNHFHFVARIDQPLDELAMVSAIRMLLEQHPSLRSIHHGSGDDPSRNATSASSLSVPVIDCTQTEISVVLSKIEQSFSSPFDLTSEVPSRFKLYKAGDSHYYIQAVVHHVAMSLEDYAKMPRLLLGLYTKELQTTTSSHVGALSKPTDIGTPAPSPADDLRGEWNSTLLPPLPSLDFPGDQPSRTDALFHPKRSQHRLNSKLVQRLRKMGKTHGSSLFSIVATAYSILLQRYTGSSDILLGVPVKFDECLRPDESPSQFACNTNTLPLRVRASSDQLLTDLLINVSQGVQRIRRNRAMSLSSILQACTTSGHSPSGSSFNSLILSQRVHDCSPILSFGLGEKGVSFTCNGITLSSIGIGWIPSGRFDISLALTESESGLGIAIYYNGSSISDQFAELIGKNVLQVLNEFVRTSKVRVEELSCICENERQQLLSRWSNLASSPSDQLSFLQAFRQQRLNSPNAIAVEHSEESTSYSELDDMSSAWAQHMHTLLPKGENPIIAVACSKSIDLVASILSVLKLGAGFLLIDSSLPKKRVSQMLRNGGVALVLCDTDSQPRPGDCISQIITMEELKEYAVQHPLAPPPEPPATDVAYIQYTSGTTGDPKAIEITHRSLDNLLASMQDHLQLASHDRWLTLTALSFDIVILELLLPLRQGAAVVIPSADASSDPKVLGNFISDSRATFAQTTPSRWKMLLDSGWRGSPTLTAISGGERLSEELANTLLDCVGSVWNAYGPAETTIWSSLAKLSYPCGPITIGRPISHTHFMVLDDKHSLLPVGAVGQLGILGDGLAKGYLGQPELTKASFIDCTYPGVDAPRIYLTGDRGRYLPSGDLQCLGRTDNQVKVRGHRIELEEVDHVARQCAGVANAASTILHGPSDHPQLALFYVGSISTKELRSHMASYLPEPVVPSLYQQLSRLPVSHNGKLDRGALRTLTPAPHDAGHRSYQAPQTKTETGVATIFSELLGIAPVGRDCNFLLSGGDSLLAARAIARINAMFGTRLRMGSLLTNPTVGAIASIIESSSSEEQATSAIPLARGSDDVPLAPSQRPFYYLHRRAPTSPALNIPVQLKLHGHLDQDRLRQAISLAVRNHDALSTIIVDSPEGPLQRRVTALPLPFTSTDLSTDVNAEAMASHILTDWSRQPFDIDVSPPVRFHLIRISADSQILGIVAHHVVFDEGSISVLVGAIFSEYEASAEGEIGSRALHKLDFRSYSLWSRTREQQLSPQDVSWWKQYLADGPQLLAIPTDKTRPSFLTYEGQAHGFRLASKEQLAVVDSIARRLQTTRFSVLLAAYHVLLSRYSGQNDINIGCPVSGRSLEDLQHLTGCLVNTVCIRTKDSSNDTFGDLIKTIHHSAAQAFNHSNVPFDLVVRELGAAGVQDRSPLFQALINYTSPLEPFSTTDLSIEYLTTRAFGSHVELALSITEDPEGLHGYLEYSTDLFDEGSMIRLCHQFQTLLGDLLEHPDNPLHNATLLSPAEEQEQAVTWNECSRSASRHTPDFLSQIEDHAYLSPHRTALVCNGRSFTYGEVNNKANAIANRIADDIDMHRQASVLLVMDRSAEFIIAALGILKSGAAYVPVDPDSPIERLRQIVSETQPTCAIVTDKTNDNLATVFAGVNILTITDLEGLSNPDRPRRPRSPTGLAYTVYTSGSTGKPKGVEIEYGAINSRVLWKQSEYHLRPHERVLHTYSFSFDGSIINYLWPLCAGATLVIPTRNELCSATSLTRLIRENRVTTVDLLPSLLQNLLEDSDFVSYNGLTRVFTGGEALPSTLVHQFCQVFDAHLYNTYGPTEATVECAVWSCDHTDPSPIAPIGRPIDGAKFYILDQHGNIAPIGVSGELCIAGQGLARGYLGDKALTAQKFVTRRIGSESLRLYRSGDLARYRVDGTVEFMGRVDSDEVKVRGFRINLSEIEDALRHMDSVYSALVIPKGSGANTVLAAYVVLSPPMDEKVFNRLMQHYLKRRLPPYMIPQFVRILDEFPTLSNGKIDYLSLPEPVVTSEKTTDIAAADAMNDTESKIAEIWTELLHVERLLASDDFFSLGGNSLLAMRLLSRLKQVFGITVDVGSLLESPTIAALARIIDTPAARTSWSPIVPLASGGHGAPLYLVHPIGGNVLCYNSLAHDWPKRRPLYGLQARGLQSGKAPHDTVESMAKEYVAAILDAQPYGPYCIGGWSFGGLVAVEMARQLKKSGHSVPVVVLVDTSAKLDKYSALPLDNDSALLRELTNLHRPLHPSQPIHLRPDREQLAAFLETGGRIDTNVDAPSIDGILEVARSNYLAITQHHVHRVTSPIVLLRSPETDPTSDDLGWSPYTNHLTVVPMPGDHWAITDPELAADYASQLETSIEAAFHSKRSPIKT